MNHFELIEMIQIRLILGFIRMSQPRPERKSEFWDRELGFGGMELYDEFTLQKARKALEDIVGSQDIQAVDFSALAKVYFGLRQFDKSLRTLGNGLIHFGDRHLLNGLSLARLHLIELGELDMDRYEVFREWFNSRYNPNKVPLEWTLRCLPGTEAPFNFLNSLFIVEVKVLSTDILELRAGPFELRTSLADFLFYTGTTYLVDIMLQSIVSQFASGNLSESETAFSDKFLKHSVLEEERKELEERSAEFDKNAALLDDEFAAVFG